MVGNFVEDQKVINVQLNQRIDNVERSLNKKLDGLQNDLNQKIDNMQYSITRLTNQQQVQEQGKLPSQTQSNPRGVHELSFSIELALRMDEVKAIITLRSGKRVDHLVPILVEETKEEKEVEPEHIIIKEDSMKKSIPPPFPQALKGKKKASNHTEILEVLRQVKINIPLLDMIKHVITYVKFLKDLCTVKRGLNVDRKAFLTE